MVKVKICGIRLKQDIEYVNIYLPDFIGFIFAKSKRQVTDTNVRELCSVLNSSIKKVGVFVNEEIDNVVRIAEICGLNVVQIHGDETPEYINNLREKLLKNQLDIEIWKAFRVKDNETLSRMSEYKVNTFLLDAYTEGKYGGSGKIFDWSLAVKAKQYGKIILAGGLSLQNIRNAIEKVNPWGIDVSSGVETDGYKDKEKIRDFINLSRISNWKE